MLAVPAKSAHTGDRHLTQRMECIGSMAYYDVFNGDADGICALHQLRLAEPREATLVTGVKRRRYASIEPARSERRSPRLARAFAWYHARRACRHAEPRANRR